MVDSRGDVADVDEDGVEYELGGLFQVTLLHRS